MPINIAIAGCEELISTNLLELLQEKSFPVGAIYLLTALDAEEQDSVRFNNHTIYAQAIDGFDWSQVELLFITGDADEYAAAFLAAEQANCKIIDLRAPAFKDNAHGLSLLTSNENMESPIHVCPDDLTVLIGQIIEPFFEETAITRLNITALAPVSIHGKKGTEILAKETAQLMNGRPLENTLFAAQQAFNILPVAQDNHLADELQQLFPKEKLNMAVTLLQAPVFYGATVVIDVTLEDPLPREIIIKMLSSINHAELSDEVLTPVTHGSNQNQVFLQLTAAEIAEVQEFRVVMVTDLLRTGRVSNALLFAEQLVTPALQ
jgi:aspartate-semialdehyde dehydrogenase